MDKKLFYVTAIDESKNLHMSYTVKGTSTLEVFNSESKINGPNVRILRIEEC